MKTSTASGLKKLFFVIITMLSMTTSFLFFVDVFSIGSGLIEDNIISVLLNGTIGVLVLDVAAIVWLRVYLQASDNNDLRAIAIVGAVIGVVGSAITSLAYLLMSASDTVIQPELMVYAQWAIAVIIVIHFVLVFLSQYKATSAKIDEQTASMLAEATDEMLDLTEQRFRDNIPALASQQAGELTRLLAGRFSNLSAMQRIRDENNGYNAPTPLEPHPARQPLPAMTYDTEPTTSPMPQPAMNNEDNQPVASGGSPARRGIGFSRIKKSRRAPKTYPTMGYGERNYETAKIKDINSQQRTTSSYAVFQDGIQFSEPTSLNDAKQRARRVNEDDIDGHVYDVRPIGGQ